MVHAVLQPKDIDESISALRGAFLRTWNAFCQATSIHGLKYTKDEETNKYIRFLWYLITSVNFLCASLMVLAFYVDYRSNPTRINVENNHAPISSLLFPPTVICPQVMFNTERSREYLSTLILPNATTAANVTQLLGSSYGFMYDDTQFESKYLELLDEVLILNELNILDFMGNLSWKCNDLIFKCRFNGHIVPCNKLFQPVRTYNGYCCAFNLNQSGLPIMETEKATFGFGNGLSLILYYNDTDYDRLKSYSHGYKVLIQETNAYPSAHSAHTFIPLNTEAFMVVTPIETVTSQDVKDLTLEERQCTYPYETKLRYFRHYVSANCELNCRATMMMKYCGCYTYFFYANLTQERICIYRDIPCLMTNFDRVFGRYRKDQCPCINSCENIKYSVGATSVPLILNAPTYDRFYHGLQHDFSVVHVYMSSQVYRRIRHDLLTNIISLVSNLGSAFSLFVGMSMVSTVEIIYYFTIILRKFYREECNARVKLNAKHQDEQRKKRRKRKHNISNKI